MEQGGNQEILMSMLRYIVEGAEYLTAAELQEVVEKLYGDEIMPTIAEQWLEEGRQKGLKEGLERGQETAFKLLRRFVARRFETALDQFDERLEGLDLAAIDRLSEVAFEAESLADFETALKNLQPLTSSSSRTNP